MKSIIISTFCFLLLATYSQSKPEFKEIPLETSTLAGFIGVTYRGLQFTPPTGKTKVGCTIKEYLVNDGKLGEVSTIVSVDCNADVRKDPMKNIFLLMCQKENKHYKLNIKVNNTAINTFLNKYIFEGCVEIFHTPRYIEGLNVMAMDRGDVWSSRKPLEGVKKLIAIEFIYK